MMAWSAFVTTAARLDYTLPRLAGRATLVGAHLSKLRGRARNQVNQRPDEHHRRQAGSPCRCCAGAQVEGLKLLY